MKTHHFKKHFLSFILTYRRYIILSRSVSKPIPEVILQNHFSIRTATLLDLPDFEKIVSPFVLENFSKRFKKGNICLIGLDAGKIIYYSWVSFQQEIFLRIKDKEAYFFDAFTLPKYRRMGIHTKMTVERLKLIKQKGCEKALLIILSKNFSVFRALKKIGFEESGSATYFNFPLLKLHYFAVIQKETGGVIEKYKSFICRSRRLNLYLRMLQEIFFSYFNKGVKDIYANYKNIPEKELVYLSQNYNLNSIERVIVVGGGAIPYTAILFAKQINKPVYIIENNRLAYFTCLNLLRKLNINSIKVIKKSGQRYDGYINNSLVIITLETISKQKILKQILSYNSHNIIIVRQPLGKLVQWFESVSLEGLKYRTIKHPQNLESIVLSKPV